MPQRSATCSISLDFFLIGFVLAFIVNGWHLTYGQSGMILLASGISAPFGSLFYGWLADKIGRRKVMILTVLNFSLATGAMALTPTGAWFYLVVCRFIVGLGVTGLYSVDITLIQEFVPTRKRGWLTGLTTTMLPAGVVLGAFLGAYATPYIGWRGLFAVGLLPALLTLYIRAWVQESPPLADAHGPGRGGTALGRLGYKSIPNRSHCRPLCRRWSTRVGPKYSNIRAVSSPDA